MSLIEAAAAAYADRLAATQGQLDEQHEQEIKNFLNAAQMTAEARLGTVAAGLDWIYTSPDDVEDGVQEATALLEKGRWDWLRFQVSNEGDNVTFELVKQCNHCGHEEAHEVDGLARLGELLAKGGER